MVCYHWVTWLLIMWSCEKLKYYITTFTKVTTTKIGSNAYENKMVPMLYVTRFIICHLLYSYVIHSATSRETITTNLGGNTYQNEMVANVMWPNHAKVIKTTTPKVALMKGTYLNRSHDLWLHDILKSGRSITGNFYRSF